MLKIEYIENFFNNYSLLRIKDTKPIDENNKMFDVLMFMIETRLQTPIDRVKKLVIELADKCKANFKQIRYIAFDSSANELFYENINDLKLSSYFCDLEKANEKMFECINEYDVVNTNFTIVYLTSDFKLNQSDLRIISDINIVFHFITFGVIKPEYFKVIQKKSLEGSLSRIREVNVDFFQKLFSRCQRGSIIDDNMKLFFSLDHESNEAYLFRNRPWTKKNCFVEINKVEKIVEIEMNTTFSSIGLEEKIKILESFFSF